IVARSRNRCLGYLIVAPIVLTAQAIRVGVLGWIFTVVILLTLDRFIKGRDRPNTPGTLRLWLIFWLIEAALPISLHFMFRTSGDAERIALIVAGTVLIIGALLTF